MASAVSMALDGDSEIAVFLLNFLDSAGSISPIGGSPTMGWRKRKAGLLRRAYTISEIRQIRGSSPARAFASAFRSATGTIPPSPWW